MPGIRPHFLARTQRNRFAQNYDQRARDIVGKLTLEEKIPQLHGIRDDEKGIYRYLPPVPRLGIPRLR